MCPGWATATVLRMSELSTPRRGAVVAWGLWDWAFSAFGAVTTTFVFTVYLSGTSVGDPRSDTSGRPA